MHRLSEIDAASKTGVCSECGPVELKWRAHRRQWACQVAERRRRKGSDWRYKGMVVEDVDEALAMLAAGCAICGSKERMCLDHDHATGVVRGALCDPCNKALGFFGDDPDRLRAALVYLGSAP